EERSAVAASACPTEPLQHLGKRTAAMAHPQLFFGRCFRECETEGLVIEVRIVAESIQSPGFLNDLPLHLTTKGSQLLTRFRQCNHRDIPGGSIANAAELFNQRPVVF